MTDQVPEPSAGDWTVDLASMYRYHVSHSQEEIQRGMILWLIARAFHAERKLAAIEAEHAALKKRVEEAPILLGSFNIEGQLVLAVWESAQPYMVPVHGGYLKLVRLVPDPPTKGVPE